MNYLGNSIVRSSDSLDAFRNTQVSTLSANVVSTTASLANTGLTVMLAANAVYQISGTVIYQCNSTSTGAKIGFSTGHIASGSINIRVPNSTTLAATILEQPATSTNSVAGSNVAVANTAIIARVEGAIVVDAAGGNLPITFACTVAANTSTTVMPGSLLIAERLA